MISIVIPVHNQADKLDACLNSIMKQSYTDWELIVVNDGSTDAIEQAVSHWEKAFGSKLQFFSKVNEGSNPTRNFGFTKTKGDYVIFCDADVIMRPTMLQEMYETLEKNPEVAFVFSSFYYGRKLFKLFPYDENRLRKMPYIHTSSLIRRKDFPGFDNAIKRFQDWDLWLTMLEHNKKGVWLNKPLFMTQLGGGHISQWLPSFAYKLLPFLRSVKKYQDAETIIKKKHGLD
jgi:glycosyltransferase involved in cell wall biosynthesis